MSKVHLTLGALLALGGCSQIIGISEYDIDPNLGASGAASNQGGEGGKSSAGANGTTAGEGATGGEQVPLGGEQNVPQGGDQNMPQAGQPMGGGSTDVGGAPPSGTLIPCDSAVCCAQMGGTAVGIEVLADGGFEGGPVEDGNTAWTEQSTNEFEIISLTDPDPNDTEGLNFVSHNGEYYAYLSGLDGELSSIYSPDFVVPADAGWMTVSGYRLFQIDTQDAMNDDFAAIALWDIEPDVVDPVELPFLWGAPATHADGWGDARSWKKFERSWDATPHRGETRYLSLSGSSDSYSTDPDTDSSSFLFDDLSLKLYRCYQ